MWDRAAWLSISASLLGCPVADGGGAQEAGSPQRYAKPDLPDRIGVGHPGCGDCQPDHRRGCSRRYIFACPDGDRCGEDIVCDLECCAPGPEDGDSTIFTIAPGTALRRHRVNLSPVDLTRLPEGAPGILVRKAETLESGEIKVTTVPVTPEACGPLVPDFLGLVTDLVVDGAALRPVSKECLDASFESGQVRDPFPRARLSVKKGTPFFLTRQPDSPDGYTQVDYGIAEQTKLDGRRGGLDLCCFPIPGDLELEACAACRSLRGIPPG